MLKSGSTVSMKTPGTKDDLQLILPPFKPKRRGCCRLYFRRSASPGGQMLPERESSSLRETSRHISIVTTACLPWRTGTAVNPLLRAAYTAHLLPKSQVVLVVPWLPQSEQKRIFPDSISFSHPDDQKKWVYKWVEKRTNFPSKFDIVFYPARYDNQGFFSIFPVGDVTEQITKEKADVAILEEPEHLTWFHHGQRWTNKFKHVVGIIHTNYVDYIRREAPAVVPLIHFVNRRMCSIHCHKVIKLSDAVQSLPRQSTCFCHGVPQAFLEVGKNMQPSEKCSEESGSSQKRPESAAALVDVQIMPDDAGITETAIKAQPGSGGQLANGKKDQEPAAKVTFTKGAYFLGKGVWGKGYTELLALLSKHQEAGGKPLPVDVYGSGEDMAAIKKQAAERKLAIKFNPGRDHLDEALHSYRVFVNPSTSDVVATTSLEALAMGKWLICPEHPSNAFFQENFSNCLIYKSDEEFSEKLEYAEVHNPKPLTKDEIKKLTWEDATERFLDAAEIKPNEWPNRLSIFRNAVTWPIINAGTGIEAVRRIIGAGKNTASTPKDLLSFDPAHRDFDWEDHLALGYAEPRIL